jgi:ribosomal protein L33
MCDKCRHILFGYSRNHQNEPEKCPLYEVAYCPVCGKHGHYMSQCPCSEILDNCQPKYIEQLIPHSQIVKYGIQSLTPLPSSLSSESTELPSHTWYDKPYDPVISLRYKAEEIKSTLRSHKIEFNEKNKMDDNIILLEKLAKKLGRQIVWVKNSTDPVEKNEKPQKPTTHSTKQSQKKIKISSVKAV